MTSVLTRAARQAINPFLAVGKAYNEIAMRHPFVVGVVTTALKTSAADLIAQKVVEGRQELDLRRHAVFCLFGTAYLGCFQYFLYNIAFAAACSPLTARYGHKGTAGIKVFLDQAVHHPFMYFPVFYFLKGMLDGTTLEATQRKYWADLPDNCRALWKIWVPAQFVNFMYVPRHMRLPFAAGTSFVWTIVLSLMRGGADPTDGGIIDQLEKLQDAPRSAPSEGTTTVSKCTSTMPKLRLPNVFSSLPDTRAVVAYN